MGSEVEWTIGAGAVLILVLGLGGGFLPFVLPSSTGGVAGADRKWWEIALNCLAGGVLFGAGVLHLLPDLVLAATLLHIQGLPTPYIFVALGLLIPAAIEQIDVDACCARTTSPAALRLPTAEPESESSAAGGRMNSVGSAAEASAEGDTEDGELDSLHGADGASSMCEELCDEAGVRGAADETHALRPPVVGDGAESLECHAAAAGGVLPRQRALVHSHGHSMAGPNTGAAILLSATLGLHSLLEGIGIGVQREVASSIGIVVAVVAHKGFAGFALGQLFKCAGVTCWKAAPAIMIFGLATPVGVVLGVVMNSVIASPWVDVVAVGLAAGTFIFVSLVEILLPALQVQPGRNELSVAWRWAAFLTGVCAFAAVGYALGGSNL